MYHGILFTLLLIPVVISQIYYDPPPFYYHRASLTSINLDNDDRYRNDPVAVGIQRRSYGDSEHDPPSPNYYSNDDTERKQRQRRLFRYDPLLRVHVKVFFFRLSLLCSLSNGLAADCSYFKYLEPGERYYIHNPSFPGYNINETYCKYQIKTSSVVRLNCDIDLLRSPGCSKCSLSIEFMNSPTRRYCGYGNFVIKGINNTFIIILSSSLYAKERFVCTIETFDDERNCFCGYTNPMKIVGGQETGINEYPMMAGLVSLTGRQIYCGATIISSHYVLTAAHCLLNRNVNTIGVVVGEHDTDTGLDTNATRLYRVQNCIVYSNDTKKNDDVAVCLIDGSIEFGMTVGPACLPFQHNSDSFEGANVTALGWGLLEFGGVKSNTLQSVNLNVINRKNCSYDVFSDITHDNIICTYTKGKDTCQMDSGGPLLWEDPKTHNLVVIGIIAKGIGCASEFPSTNIRVGSYIGWILNVTMGEKYCKIE